uniref:hypothetical protein n=1 Tax=Mariniflexile sp. TaxID=1979402 RepID=UPI0040470B32
MKILHNKCLLATNVFVIIALLFFTSCNINSNEKTENKAENSYSMLPLITGEKDTAIRDCIVHHSIDGAFAIRTGDWKLNVCPDSRGRSYSTENNIIKDKIELPTMQLYNLKDDIREIKNLIVEHPEIAKELKAALKKIILDGRSTQGTVQKNEGIEGWKQIELIVN